MAVATLNIQQHNITFDLNHHNHDLIDSNTSVYNDARIDARNYSVDALLAFADVLRRDANDPDPDFPGEVGRFLASQRLRAVTDELHRHERISRLAAGVPTVADARYEGWRNLAAIVRDRVDVVEILHTGGCDLHFVGKNSRRGSDEYAGPCPLCGGTDRLRAWSGPNGRFWCRQCNWSGDVIVATSLIPGNAEFRDALTFLAAFAGTDVEVPR